VKRAAVECVILKINWRCYLLKIRRQPLHLVRHHTILIDELFHKLKMWLRTLCEQINMFHSLLIIFTQVSAIWRQRYLKMVDWKHIRIFACAISYTQLICRLIAKQFCLVSLFVFHTVTCVSAKCIGFNIVPHTIPLTDVELILTCFQEMLVLKECGQMMVCVINTDRVN
jgi:hypothetical protein